MDFKQRHPELKRWPFWVLENQKRIFPYNCIPIAQLNEFAAFDGSTTFLLRHDAVCEKEQTWRSYAIEAPKDWDVRRRFERGLINWSEFFNERGWIMELSGDWALNSDTQCRYIEFSEVSSKIKQKLADLDRLGSPYQILHDHLLDMWTFRRNCGRDAASYQERYESLIKNHGHMLTSIASETTSNKTRVA